ncbi:carbohydrate esterase family 3 protein [Pseudocercospora fijiensis CIRAD86]|uniref:Carbohydrate esterase family 3 protein n=1 Tax=Pseudocercospora fijiensis (strain CIRAD86) TaxID=383855 RepID=M3A6F0_PSEFD|nr:carbohydrate esterase family 3 protein [Pseudocercospora fijiensis CIRAD86]EME86679.1 carbohydrate esterase family 3 protein [Pseudocercospora fijiensis CIRAD86]
MSGILGLLCSVLWSISSSFCSDYAVDSSSQGACTVARDVPLRMLAIGDSITAGWGDPEQNSYRLPLWNRLEADCKERPIFFIGKYSGSMSDNLHEGYPGYSAAKLATDIEYDLYVSLYLKPNVVFIHAGTNDCDDILPQPKSAEAAASNVGKLIDMVVHAVPNVTVLVAQIITSDVPGKEFMPMINRGIREVVAARADAGFKVMTVDMSRIGVDGTDLADGLHPNPQGYRKMANLWFEVMQVASGRGWITPPAEVTFAKSRRSVRDSMRRVVEQR